MPLKSMAVSKDTGQELAEIRRFFITIDLWKILIYFNRIYSDLL